MDQHSVRKVGAAAQSLGDRIRTFRKLNRLTIEQVAERAGLSRGTVTRVESGDLGVSLSSLLLVCRALGVLEMLVDGLDPHATAIGRAQFGRSLPQRVRN